MVPVQVWFPNHSFFYSFFFYYRHFAYIASEINSDFIEIEVLTRVVEKRIGNAAKAGETSSIALNRNAGDRQTYFSVTQQEIIPVKL